MSDIEKNSFRFGEDDFSENYLNEILEKCKIFLEGELQEAELQYIDNSIEVLLDNYRYEEVLSIVKDLISVNPFDYENYYRAGFCLFRMNEPTLAYRSLNKAQSLNPNDSAIMIEKAMVCIHINRLKEAAINLKKAYYLDKEDPRVFFSYGIIYKRIGKFEKAVKFLKKAAKLDPEDSEVLYLLAHCYRDMRNYGFAMDTIEKYLVLEPKCSDGWAFKGQILERLNRIERALNSFSTSIALDPLNLSALFSFVELNISLRKYKIAMDSLNQALVFNSTNFAIYFKLGEILMLKQDFFAAAAQFTKAIIANRKFASSYVERAYCNLKIGEYALALHDFHNALIFATKDGKGLWGSFGKWGFKLGDEDSKYISHFEDILKIDSSNNTTWLHLAEIKLDYKNPHHALIALSNALANKPMNGKAFFILSRLAYRLGNVKQGLAYLRAAFKADKSLLENFKKKTPIVYYSRIFKSLFDDLIEKS